MNYRKKNPKKLLLIIIVCVLVLGIGLTGALIYSKSPKPFETFKTYKQDLENQDFKAMYSLLSTEAKGKISEDDFVKRYENIFKGIEANNLEVSANDGEDEKKVRNMLCIDFFIVQTYYKYIIQGA